MSASTYRGWETQALTNGLIEVQVLPQIGGRVIQFKLGDTEMLWVNDALAGKAPPPGGLGPKGAWLNYGGDKLWPAPQDQWHGPPDGVLDGSPHTAVVLPAAADSAGVELTSEKDPRNGLQFKRTIRVRPGAAAVAFDSTLTNVGTKTQKWSIWQVTQLSAVGRKGDGFNKDLRCWTPVNPASQYPLGFNVQFGAKDNPSFAVDTKTGLFSATYKGAVGKAGLDSAAGWVACVDGETGCVLVERFAHVPGKEYPDGGSSVEFWMNGAGKIVHEGKTVEFPADRVATPTYVESEILSPLAELAPGQSTSFRLDWFAAKIGGSYPVLACTPVGITCEALAAKKAGDKVRLTGRFGVFFAPSPVQVVFLDAAGAECGKADLKTQASPLEPLVLDAETPLPAKAATAVLMILDAAGQVRGELARVTIQP